MRRAQDDERAILQVRPERAVRGGVRLPAPLGARVGRGDPDETVALRSDPGVAQVPAERLTEGRGRVGVRGAGVCRLAPRRLGEGAGALVAEPGERLVLQEASRAQGADDVLDDLFQMSLIAEAG